jgi:hypothetical protein
MSQCHALKKNNTRCRAFASIESCSDDLVVYKHTCKAHANFFDTFTLNKNLIESLEFWGGISEFLKEAFDLGLICVKEDFITGLSNHSKYSYFYFLAAKYSHGFKFWNIPLYHKTIRILYSWIGRIGPVQMTDAEFLHLVKPDPILGFYSVLYNTHWPWETVRQLCAKEDWFEEFYHTDESIHESIITQFSPNYSNHKEWLNDAKYRYYQNIRDSCPFKDELIAAAWVPERVLDWCMDAEERDYLLSR